MDILEWTKHALVHMNRHISKHLISTLLFVFIVYSLICAFLFYYSDYTHAFNNKKGSKLDAMVDGIYFTTSTMTTVGYGDITPISKNAKLLVIIMELSAMFLGMRLFDSIVQMKPELLI